MEEKKPEKSVFAQLLDASTIGIQLVVSTFVGLAMGYGLDYLFGTEPYLTFVFLILGIIAGFRELVKMARKQQGGNNGNNNQTG
ncbi:MAG: AtpZ/AtpI family protein [Nitrospirota bacterium]